MIPAVFAAGFFSTARAAVTVRNFWKLDDLASPYADSAGASPLDGGFGSHTRSTSVVEPGAVASTLFSNAGAYQSSAGLYPTIAENNVLMEVWVNPTLVPASDASILSFGGVSGAMQIGIHNGNWFFGVQNISYNATTTAAVANVWTNLAYVVDSGVLKAYVNGTLVATETATLPTLTGTGQTLVGTGAGGSSTFSGYIGNVRYSTFEAGQFSTADLMVNAVPESSTWGLISAGAFAGVALIRRRKTSR